MTKFSLVVLKVLNDNDIDNSSKALSVSQLLMLIEETQRKSYSTTYRHLAKMAQTGYVKCGLADGLASTYFIAEKGKSFCKAQY